MNFRKSININRSNIIDVDSVITKIKIFFSLIFYIKIFDYRIQHRFFLAISKHTLTNCLTYK